MSKIVINTEDLIKNAESIAKKRDELNALNKQLENLIMQMMAKWEGEACKTYINMMQKYLRQAKQMIKVLQEFQKYAENVSTKFSQLDKNSANKINGC